MRRLRILLPLAGLLAALPAVAAAQGRVEPLPGLAGAADAIVAGADGAMYASLPADPGRIVRITPAGAIAPAGTGGLAGFPAYRRPSGLASLSGVLWFELDGGPETFARLWPGYPVSAFSLSAGRPTSLAGGIDGALWMTVEGGAGRPDGIGRFVPSPLDETTYALDAQAGPRSLTAAPDGSLWFVEGSRLGRITTAGALSYRPVPGPAPEALTVDAAGALWYAQGSAVHRLDDPTAYDAGSPVTALAAGPDGAVWAATQGGAARIVAGEPPTHVTESIDPAAQATALAAGPDGRLWLGLDRAPYLVRLTVAPAVRNVTLDGGLLIGVVTPNGLDAVATAELQQPDGTWRELARTTLAGTATPQAVRIALPALPAGRHAVRLTATNAAGTTSSPPFELGDPITAAAPPVPTAAATPTPTSGPVEGESVEVAVVSGVVSYRGPQERTYTRLTGKAVLPLGVLLDTTSGKVRIGTQVDGRTQLGTFNGGKFGVTQTATGMTELALAGALSCSIAERTVASASATKNKKKKRSIWGKDTGGSFRTRGNGSVATVRGTEWRTEDTCAGTTVSVREGVVSVWPRRGGRSKLVRAGQRLFSPRPR